MTLKRLLAAVPVFVFTASVRAAAIPGLFNAGVDGAGAALSHGSVDSHYCLISAPSGGTTSMSVHTSAGGHPIDGSWIGDSTVSAWIGPNTGAAAGPVGGYVYRTTFDLTGFDPATASISGRWSADNSGGINLNGASTGATANSFSAYSPFSINSGFVAGINTLDFLVNNASIGAGGFNPTGMRLEILSSSVTAVPEPSTSMLLLAGLAFAGVVAQRRKRSLHCSA